MTDPIYQHVSYEEIVISALLHDIGKIAQRAEDNEIYDVKMELQVLPKAKQGEYYTHKHALYTYGALEKLAKDISSTISGIRPSVVARLAADHHNPSHWAEFIISESDRLSSGADRKENEDDTTIKKSDYFEHAQQQALQSIFSSVSFSSTSNNKKMYYPLDVLNSAFVYPQSEQLHNKESYKKIWKGLQESIAGIKESDFNNYLMALDTVLEYWTWAVPSSTVDEPDISLYDHARTTAAFASVLYRWHEANGSLNENAIINNDEKFALVSGDISGIQKYLFDLKKTAKSAKMLRARSFEIRAITDIIAQHILEDFKVNHFCLFSSAGGRFIALLPNYKQANEKLQNTKNETERILLKKYMGSLAICLSDLLPVKKEDFLLKNQAFRKTFDKLQEKSRQSKYKKLQTGLQEQGPVLDYYYDHINSGSDVCPMCDTKPVEHGEYCNDCNALISLGEKLPKAQYIRINDDGDIPLLFNKRLTLYQKKQTNFSGALSVNTFEKGIGSIRLPYTVPMNEDNTVKEFDEIAKSSNGAPYLAMFKADLDNLGKIFSQGLGQNLSISRYASLSRMLDYFFSVRLRELIEEKWKDYIYCVYAGGDDVCVIGAWDRVIDFGIQLQKEFSEFTGNTRDITISGGIALSHVGLPISRIAEMAEEELDSAKRRENKNSISFIGLPLSWETFNENIKLGKEFSEQLNLQDKKLSTTLVYRLISFSKKAQAFKREIHTENILWKSHYLYTLKRLLGIEKELYKNLVELSLDTERMIHARIAATYGLYSIRNTNNGHRR